MESDRWKEIEAIYNSALELGAAEREEFLAIACAGNDGLKQEVSSLLSSARRFDSFLDEPVLSIGLALMGRREPTLVNETIGRYKLLELLGRGGMGEVYLAHDPRLNRRIALKLLPTDVYGDRERVRRFEQEAHAASVISHPCVAPIYEIGEEDGCHYITMEYVRGRTLREAMKEGPLCIRDAVNIAAQVASAIAAAHESGVVHRDVKPENIMIRDDSYVKVLDFGLAKLVDYRPRGQDTETISIPSVRTEPELLMGTPDYMSPEQVRREPVDGRTDLWSLGVLLYEMVAGRRPFRGNGHGEIIVAILEREPEPLDEIKKGIPRALQEVVSKALVKRAAYRYQSAADMAVDLRRVGQLIEEGQPGLVHGSAGHTIQAAPSPAKSSDKNIDVLHDVSSWPFGVLGRMADIRASAIRSIRITSIRHSPRAAYWLVPLSLAGIALYFGLVYLWRPALSDKKINLQFERLNLSGGVRDVTLSPDGKYVASVIAEDGRQSIHITELATASDLRVVPPSEEGYSGLSFSPDGNYLCYLENRAETGTLYRVSKLGGGQRKVLENVNTAVTFSPDGSHMAFVRSNNSSDPADLVVAKSDGTSVRVLAKRSLADKNFFLSDMKGAGPAWSPDGKVLACPSFDFSNGLLHEVNVEVLDADTGVGRRLNTTHWYDISRIAWLADGSGLVVAVVESATAPWQLRLLDYPDGGVRKITNDPNNYSLVSSTRDSSLFLTRNIEENASIWKLSVSGETQPAVSAVSDRKGVVEVESGTAGRYLFTINDGTHVNLWTQDAGAVLRQLTYDADNSKPTVSPDGHYIVFVSSRSGAKNIWRMNVDGTQQVRLTAGPYEDLPQVTADGKWVFYRTGSAIKKISIDGGDSIKLFDKSALSPALSPDGRLLAFFTNDQSDSQVWHIEVYDTGTLAIVKRFEVPKATLPFNSMSLTPDNRLRWQPDGAGIAYVSNADGASNVWLQGLAGGAPKQLTRFSDAEIPSFAWSANGKQIVCVRITKAYVPLILTLF